VQARLLRYGDAFIDGIWHLTQRDDRGQSTALWRYVPGHISEGVADLFFRFDFIVETDLEPALAVLAVAERLNTSAHAATARRGDMALPPFFRCIWLDQEFKQVRDEGLLSKLAMAYRPTAADQGGRDFNLNPTRWNNLDRLRLPQLYNWRSICAKARDRAEEVLRAETSFVDSLGDARDRASAVDLGRIGQLRARAERRDDPADAREWALERDLADALNFGITRPAVRVDSVIAYFLSGESKATTVVDGRL
jgi:ATP-dependent helicase HepA